MEQLGCAVDPPLDVVGVGFGVSNLALAVALEECAGRRGDESLSGEITALFLEKQKSFGWHRGMLIEGAMMQISFLKDIVTMRNPTSDYSFLSYLHERNRLVDFINHHTMIPSRIEFHDYLAWAADRLRHVVKYGVEVTGVRPVFEDGAVTHLDVLGQDLRVGEVRVQRTRNLVIAAGLRPHLPADLPVSERIWHSSEFLHRLAGIQDPPRRVAVIGAGQSAAEVASHLMDRYPAAEVCAVFSRYGYSVADSTPFANRIFDPAAVDDYYFAPSEVKESLLRYHANTNYSVVDPDVIDNLYRRQYQQRVVGEPKLRVLNTSRVAEVSVHEGGVTVVVESLPTGEITKLDADIVIYATGYRPADPEVLLSGLDEFIRRDELGVALIGRDYGLMTTSNFHCGIYLQSATESTHGISSSLLSNTAVRAGEIARSLTTSMTDRLPRPGHRLPERSAGKQT
jgi:L-ornithine N5-oxygenase